MIKTILWDLDGTLTDPREGILRSIQHALREAGQPVLPEDELLWTIGPPLHVAFTQLVPEASESEVWALVAKYRERFSSVGLFENRVIDGIADLFASLPRVRHFLATSKPHVFATRIIEHFGLSPSFVRIYGSELDGTRSDKAELISHILRSESLPPHECVMIGDRKYDITGGRACGLRTIGVMWGYGSREEFTNAGADFVFDEVSALRDFLMQETRS